MVDATRLPLSSVPHLPSFEGIARDFSTQESFSRLIDYWKKYELGERPNFILRVR